MDQNKSLAAQPQYPIPQLNGLSLEEIYMAFVSDTLIAGYMITKMDIDATAMGSARLKTIELCSPTTSETINFDRDGSVRFTDDQGNVRYGKVSR